MVLAVSLALICGILLGFVMTSLTVASKISDYEDEEIRYRSDLIITNAEKDSLQSKVFDLESRLDQRDRLIKNQEEQLKNNRNTIVDLSNNIEFLVNNLSAQKKKLAGLGKSN